MARKSSKKPAGNPARGFTTVSTVSKSKNSLTTEEARVPESKDTQDGTAQKAETSSIEAPQPQITPDNPLAHLTPEQLEAELEESELQLLVDENSVRSKKDSSRHTSRLHTERRLLRSSAEPLTTSSWLTPDLLEEVLNRLISENKSEYAESRTSNDGISGNLSAADLTVRIWTLKRTLKSLGFAENRIEETIVDFVSNRPLIQRESSTASKDSLWALEESLSHLALISERDELPGYDSHRTEKHEREKRQQRMERDTARAAQARASSRTSEKGSTDISITNSGAATPYVSESNERATGAYGLSESSDGASMSDSEEDPAMQVDKYINFQRKLFARCPELTIVAPQGRKKSKQAPAVQPNLIDARSSKILKKLEALENDILFDKDAAVQKWMEIRVNLVAEAAERRRYLGQPTERHRPQPKVRTRNEPELDEDHDDSMGLGDFFSSLPEETRDETTGTSQLQSNSGGVALVIRDFRKWSGTSPRRVLEETCKARDSHVRTSYSLISSTTFANRHLLRIEWSKPQELSITISVAGVISSLGDRSASIEMSEVACPDKSQSEAFVSTAALFLLFSTSPKEEKTFLRLPAVWRDLWGEFSGAKKEQLDRAERDELRSIKKLAEDKQNEQETTTNGLADRTKSEMGPSTVPSTTSQHVTQTSNGSRAGHDELSELWQSKSSSPTFRAMLKTRKSLPIFAFREELLNAIDTNQAIILCGETGCGKSTQVPSFVLEYELSNGRPCKIYCTEPRRISAISLARRVSEELGERKNDVGTLRSLVGYAIRLESQVTSSTRLVFATTGILMRMLERENDLGDITHLILDEVHERTIDSDFLLIVLRKLMARRPNLKVILMSATVNADQFSSYLGNAPILNVPGRTFPVETKYLEDAIEVTGYGAGDKSISATTNGSDRDLDEDGDDMAEESQHSASSGELVGYSVRTRNVLAGFDEKRLDYDLLLQLLETVAVDDRFTDYSKAILVFLPGIAEIRHLNDMLVGHQTFSNGWEIFPLHSTIATEEQERAFLLPPPGIRKVVIATNIAETGITIPDVTCVIDTGKHKEMRFDERRQLSRLIESFISRANAKQRRGRAGRVQNGLCFHLFTRARHDRLMADSQTPEMLRLSLQDLALRVRICKLGNIEQVLSEALDPPLSKNVRRAVDALVAVKALTPSEDLTALGRQLAKLPLDVYLGKLILQANIFHCLDAGVTIAAILSSKSPFQAPFGSRFQADSVRLGFKKGNSDLLTNYNAYCAWRRICNATGASEYQWCRKNFLSPQTLSNIEDLKAQLCTALVDAGFLSLGEADRASLNRARFSSRRRHFVDLPPSSSTNSSNDLIVDSVIAWSFYPKLLIRDGKGYRNVANNQSVSLYPSSVNKGVSDPPKLLSFYQIMQSSTKYYNAHETSAVEDFAVALAVGEADFKMYSGVIVIDGNRLRFSVNDWKTMLALKALRSRVREIITQSYRSPSRSLTATQSWWYDLWLKIFTQVAQEKA